MTKDQMKDLDTVSLKLMCAGGVLSAIMTTFDDATSVNQMPPDKLHEALYAASELIRDARAATLRIA